MENKITLSKVDAATKQIEEQSVALTNLAKQLDSLIDEMNSAWQSANAAIVKKHAVEIQNNIVDIVTNTRQVEDKVNNFVGRVQSSNDIKVNG